MVSTIRRANKKSGGRRAQKKELAPTQMFESPRRNVFLISLFLAATSFLVYARSLFNGFVDYDDQLYITRNPHVRAGLTRETLRWAFTTFTAGHWHPLTWISHALDVQMYGLSPAGHHLNGMIFHALNVVLLFLLLWKATGSQGRSLIVAGLFAVHPLNVECVAWAAERKSLLSTALFFLALAAYGWYVKRPSAGRYGILAVLFALGLMAKSMFITLPFVLLLLDYWPLQRMDSWTPSGGLWSASRKTPLSLLLEKVPLLLLSAASAVTTVIAGIRGQAVVSLSVTPLWSRVENAICSYALYLFKAVWPVGLAVFYPETDPRLSQVVLSLLLLFAISLWVWRERRPRPYLLVGWCWYLGTLVPVIGLIQSGLQAMADRYAYAPLIGIFVMAVWRIADAADARAYSLRSRIAVAAVILFALALLTWRQVGFWRGPFTLWTHALQVTPDNVIAETNFGTALIDLGREDDAIPHFRSAIRLRPTEPTAHIDLGFLLRKREPREAIDQLQTALSLTNDSEDLRLIYSDLADAYRQVGDYESAGESLQRVLRLDPSNSAAMVALGNVTLLQAADRLAAEVRVQPTAQGYAQLGGVLENAGEINRAQEAYRSALALDPKMLSAQGGLQRLASRPQ